MSKSPTVIWQRADGGGTDDYFRIAELDETANGGSDLIQNNPIYIIAQHSPLIKITDIKSSMGQVQPNPLIVQYSQNPDKFDFNIDNQIYNFQYTPDVGSVGGLWFINYPAKQFGAAGTPSYILRESERTLTVDIANFYGGKPAPFKPEYTATFLQYEFIPETTDLATSDDTYEIGITFFYKVI